MAKLSAGISREDACNLLKAHNKDEFHIEHGETVENTNSILRTRNSGASSACCTIWTGKNTTTIR